jgi:hypothetical protein
LAKKQSHDGLLAGADGESLRLTVSEKRKKAVA